MSVVATILAFAGLIVFHELGHFLLARLSGMKVERFAVGFGPALFKKQVGETEYAVCALPLGGYVKIAGMEPAEEGEVNTDPRAYNNRPAWQRLLVITAGPVFNYILAAILFAAVLMMGPLVADTSQARIGEVIPGEPAAEAGLQKEDLIVSVDGQAITDWKSFQEAVYARPDEAADVVVEREGEEMTLQITPRPNEVEGKTVGMIGVLPTGKRVDGKPFGEAVVGGFAETWRWNVRIVEALGKIFSGTEEAKLQGPVAIIQRTSQAAEEGMVPLLLLVALISVHLGLFNLLPIPALDGGRLVFLVAEVVRRKPVNAKVEMAVHAVGFILLMGLILLITVGDIRDLFAGS